MVDTIVCPLIITVLPGTFYYYVIKETDEEGKAWKQTAGIAYAAVGLLTLPVFLTLASKNLFSPDPLVI